MTQGFAGPHPGRVARHRPMTHVRSWAAALVRLVLPVSCAGCAAADVTLCPSCAEPLRSPARVVPDSGGLVPAWACAAYRGSTAALITSWKDRGRLDLTSVFASVLARSVVAAVSREPPWRPLVLVPVPSSPRAVRGRGADVVHDLARRAAATVRVERPCAAVRALRVTRRLDDQARLHAGQRRRNVAGAFVVRPAMAARLAGAHCVVVDDVITTGASAQEAARALEAAGARVVAIATVCVTVRRYAPDRRGRDQRFNPRGPGHPNGGGRGSARGPPCVCGLSARAGLH